MEVVKDAPLDRLLLETDAPYLAPVPFRGKRCDSSMILYSAETVSYTHLDVYKRQRRPHVLSGKWAEQEKGLQAFGENFSGGFCHFLYIGLFRHCLLYTSRCV